MSRFAPTTVTIDPPPDAPVDQLGGAVLRSLSRAPHQPAARGMLGPLILGALTVGVLPLITLPRRFRIHARFESEQLWYAHEWFRLNAVSPAGRAPRADFPPVRPLVSILCHAARVIGIAMVVAFLTNSRWHQFGPWTTLWGRWGVGRMTTLHVAWFQIAWVVGLTIGYALLMNAIRVHASRARRQVKRIDEVIRQAGLPGIELGPTLGGGSAAWLIIGVVLAATGAIWALPMVLAAWMQSGYTTITSPHVRRQLLARLRLAMARQTPQTRAALPRSLQQRCADEHCLKPLPPDALYCPRCGAAVATA